MICEELFSFHDEINIEIKCKHLKILEKFDSAEGSKHVISRFVYLNRV